MKFGVGTAAVLATLTDLISEKQDNKRQSGTRTSTRIFLKNQCETRQTVYEPVGFNMKFPLFTIDAALFAFMDFLPALCICVSCSRWG